MAYTTWLAQQSRAVGTYSFGPFAVPAGLSVLSVQLTSTGFTQATRSVNASLEASLDGGTNWIPFGGIGVAGGIFTNKQSQVINPQWDVFLDPNQYPTHLRGKVVIAGGAVTCGVQGQTV